jgi:large conductance mechanosensitive channel
VIQQFKDFLLKTSALALAVGVIIGAASGKVVSALVADILMPIIGLILPKGDWREASIVLSTSTDAAGKVSVSAIKYGDFLGNMVDFIAISFVVYLIARAFIKPAPAAPSQTCPFCKEANAVDATKCKACTSALTPAA